MLLRWFFSCSSIFFKAHYTDVLEAKSWKLKQRKASHHQWEKGWRILGRNWFVKVLWLLWHIFFFWCVFKCTQHSETWVLCFKDRMLMYTWYGNLTLNRYNFRQKRYNISTLLCVFMVRSAHLSDMGSLWAFRYKHE